MTKYSHIIGKKIRLGLSLNILWQIVPTVAAIFTIPFAIANYGESKFAVYALAMGFLVGLNYLNLGVATNVNRELSAARDNDVEMRAQIFWSGLISMIVISFVIQFLFNGGLSFYASKITSKSTEVLELTELFFRSVVLQTPLVLILIFFRAVLESELKFKVTAANRALLNTTLLSAPVIVANFNYSFSAIPTVFLIAHFCSLLYLAICCRKYLSLPIKKFKFHIYVNLFKSGASLTFISLGMLVFLYCDRYILSIHTDLVQVAYFVIPLDILTRISFIYGSIGAVFFPVFSRLSNQSSLDRFMDMFRASYWLVFLLVGSIIVTLVLFSSELVSIWLGEEFSTNAVPVMNILAIGIMMTGLTAIPGRALIALKQEAFISYFYLCFGAIYLIFSYIIIGQYGVRGAAYAFLARSIVELAFLNGWLSFKIVTTEPSVSFGFRSFIMYTMSPVLMLPLFLIVDFSIGLKILSLIAWLFVVLALVYRPLISLPRNDKTVL